MPFYIQEPPTIDIPRTVIEINQTIGNKISKNLVSFDLNKDLLEDAFLKDKFKTLEISWENNTMFSSSISSIIEDNNFKRIVQMGKKAIPLIIEQIDKKPSNLVWALNIITGTTLKTNHRITISEACRTWVKLYKSGKLQ